MKIPFIEHFFNRKDISKKFSNEVVDYAIKLMDGNISYRRIALAIELKFGINISTTTLNRWHDELKPKVLMGNNRKMDYESRRIIAVKNEYNTWKRHKEKQIGSINATY